MSPNQRASAGCSRALATATIAAGPAGDYCCLFVVIALKFAPCPVGGTFIAADFVNSIITGSVVCLPRSD